MINAEIKFEGAIWDPNKSQVATRKVIKGALVAASEFLKTEVALATPVGVGGDLSKAWGTEWDEANQEAVVFNPVEYGLVVELGRKAAPVPIKPYARWFQRKLGLSPKEAIGAAIASSKKKAKQATPGQFFTKKTFASNLSKINENFIQPIGGNLIQELSR